MWWDFNFWVSVLEKILFDHSFIHSVFLTCKHLLALRDWQQINTLCCLGALLTKVQILQTDWLLLNKKNNSYCTNIKVKVLDYWINSTANLEMIKSLKIPRFRMKSQLLPKCFECDKEAVCIRRLIMVSWKSKCLTLCSATMSPNI